jgi:hypothetical protein
VMLSNGGVASCIVEFRHVRTHTTRRVSADARSHKKACGGVRIKHSSAVEWGEVGEGG